MSVCFFFQAEDGIRDLVRSRGLGDVYKRQGLLRLQANIKTSSNANKGRLNNFIVFSITGRIFPRSGDYPPVSYTHLTLPTSDLV